MKLTPETAIKRVNADLLKAARSPIFEKAAELAVEKFVQLGLDALVAKGHLELPVKFSVKYDQKKGQFMAFLSGTF